MQNRRVVVTGIGVISALGNTREEFWSALAAGRPGIAPIERVDRSRLRFQNGAEVRGFDPATHFEAKRVELMDRFAQFGVVAAREAVADAAVEWSPTLLERAAVVTGSCVGGEDSHEMVFTHLLTEQRKSAHPLTVPRVMANAAASHISMDLGTMGPAYTLATACASSSHAIGMAYSNVRSGLADIAIAGGSEAPFAMGHLKAWEAIRAVSPDTCRPFTLDRRGMILGEAGAMLVLEPLDAAVARGVQIYGEVVGFGMSSDANHLTAPSSDGAARAMRAALADGEIAPEQVGYVNAHGTGTAANDGMEIRALRAAFGAHAERLAVSSTKSMHGHTLGAAGAIEAAATLLALRCGILPPTANYTRADPECDLDVIPNDARRAEVDVALSNSFAFGGLNAVLAFRRWGG